MKVYKLLLASLLLLCCWTSSYAQCGLTVSIKDTLIGGYPWAKAVVQDVNNSRVRFLWSNGDTSQTTYRPTTPHNIICVQVTDSLGCSARTCDTMCSVSLSVYDTIISMSTVEVRASAYIGTYPFLYSYNHGAVTAAPQYLTAPGMVYVAVVDAHGCYAFDTNRACVLAVSIRDSVSSTPILVAHATNNSYNYSFHWSTGATSSGIYDPTLHGTTYCVTATDQIGCTASACNTPCEFNAYFRDTVIGSNNLFSITTSTGTPSYTFITNSGYFYGSSFTVPTSTGTFAVQMQDGHGCYFRDTLATTACTFSAYDVATTLTGGNGVRITIPYLYNGVGPYTYHWTDGSTNAVDTVHYAGIYFCTVTDANGCTAHPGDTVTSATLPCHITDALTYTPVGNDYYTFTTHITGATSAHTVYWDAYSPTAYINPYSSNNTSATYFLPAGQTYHVLAYVDDSLLRCSQQDSIIINTTCHLLDTISYSYLGSGRYSFTPYSAGASAVGYGWSFPNTATYQGYSGTSILYTFPAGTTLPVILYAYDSNSTCTASDTVYVTTPACIHAATFTMVRHGSSATIKVHPSSTAHVTYYWIGMSDFTDSLVTSAPGTYCVRIVDSVHNCADTFCYTYSSCHLHARIIDSSFAGYHRLIAANDSGTAPYTYRWTGQTYGGTTGSSISPFINGNYCLTVTDVNGCTASTCDSVNIPCVMQARIADSVYSTYHILHARTTGGSPGTTFYQWTNSQGTSVGQVADLIVQQSGNYCVTRTDTNGCHASACDSVVLGCALHANYTYTHVGASYTFTVTNTTGIANYILYVDGGFFVSTTYSPFTITLPAGNHTVSMAVYSSGRTCRDSVAQAISITACNLAGYMTDSATHAAAGNPSDVFTAHITTGVSPYTYRWNYTGTTSSIAITPGTHLIRCVVTDANGCSVTLTDTVANNHCGNTYETISSVVSGANITLTANNPVAVAPNSYLWSNGATTQSITVRDTYAIYCCSIIDWGGCSSSKCDTVIPPGYCTAVINTTTYPTRSVLHTTVSGGGTTHTYHWSTNATSDSITVTASGTYCVTITDATGCSAVVCSTVSAGCHLAGTISAHNLNTGAVILTAAATAGSGQYNYTWTGGRTGANDTVYNTGNYCVTITDGTGCSAVICDSARLNCTLSNSLVDTVTNPTCSINSGSVHIGVVGGTAIYQYKVGVNGAWQLSNIFAGLTAGADTFYVSDSHGCTKTIIAVLTRSITYPTVAPTSNSPVAVGGSLQLFSNLTGGTGTITYSWTGPNGFTSTSANPIVSSVTSAAAGAYQVTVRSGTTTSSCSANGLVNVTITGGTTCTLTGAVQQRPGNGTDTLFVSTSGAHGALTYHWSTGATTPTIVVTTAATYCVTITDTSACTATACALAAIPNCTISNTLTDTITNPGCTANSGTVHLGVVSGTSVYQYKNGVNGTYQSSNIFTGLTAGTDTFYVRDASFCTRTIIAILTRPATYPTVAPTSNSPVAAGGTLNLFTNLTGGTGTITYSWTGPNGFTSTLANPTITGVTTAAAGAYHVTVSSGGTTNSCSANGLVNVTITGGTTCTLTGTVTNQANTTYSILTAAATGAHGAVTYHWSNNSSTSNVLTVTASGTYCVTMTDTSGCTASACSTVTISGCTFAQQLADTVTVPGCNPTGGAVKLGVVGGTSNYQYKNGINGVWQTSNTFSNLTAGTDTFYVKDANGCFKYTVVVLTRSSSYVTVAPTSNSPVAVGGTITLFANAAHTSGTTTYSWTGPNGFTSTAANPTIPGATTAASGSYYVTVHSGTTTSCSANGLVNVIVSSNGCSLSAAISGQTTNTYSILTATTLGAHGPATYHWSGSTSTSGVLTVTASGYYCVTVTDTSHCSAVACSSVTIGNCTFSNALTDTLTNPACNATGGAVHLGVVSGTSSYLYKNGINGGYQSSNIFTGLTAGTDTFYVRDANGCTKTIIATLTRSSTYPAVAPTSNSPVAAGGTLILFSHLTGGSGTITYSWTGPNGFTSTLANPTITGVTTAASGTYHLTVNTGGTTSSCSANGLTTVVIGSCSLAGSITSQANGPTGILTAHAAGAHGTPAYHWSTGATTTLLTVSTVGTYCVTITDSTGCSATTCASFSPIFSDTLCGTVFRDLNNNGVEDNGEVGIPGQYIYIIQGSTYIKSGVTDANGHYVIGVPAGSYQIQTNIPVGNTTIPIGPGTSGTASYSTAVALGGGHHCGYDFGVVDSNIIISGYVYLDANNNGVKDPGEAVVANQQIHIGPHSVFTNSSGYYAYTDVRGSYSLTYVPSSTYSAYTVTPSGYYINATTGGASYDNNNFGLYLAASTCNIATTIVPITTITAGFRAWYNVYVQNYGTNTASGTLTFYYDPALAYTYSNPAHTSVNTVNRFVTFNYSNIPPGQYAVFTINFNALTTVTPGLSTFEMATATDNCNESNYADNTDTLHQTATASWDPNLKIVTPSGSGPQGLISRDQELRYTIGFQNTGNSPAVNIVLQDELAATLDVSTLRVIAASHPDYTLELIGNHLTCRFSQIMLPDSTTDERASHGFLSFAILPVAGLSDGTSIENTADIYFDYNEAVVTNTTLNTIDYTLSVAQIESHATITVAPNPFSVSTTIRVTGADMHGAVLDIYDGLGQIADSATPDADGIFTISRGSLSSGIYSYHIRQAGRTIGTGKLVIE